MVYCGKPSRGCQMCRTRRIKCDETKPTCNQCQKSRRTCPGYKDDFDIIFRNETKATADRARRGTHTKKSHTPPISSNRDGQLITFAIDIDQKPSPEDLDSFDAVSPSSDGESIFSFQARSLKIPIEEQAPFFFISNFVRLPRGPSSRGSFDFLLPIIRTERTDSHISVAFQAVALASLANRPSARSSGLMSRAIEQYSKALKGVNLALQNPAQQKSDATLGSIILLGFFETITSERTNVMAWGSHVDGAVQLCKMRGRKQLRTKTGLALFLAVRAQMMIYCMSASKSPLVGTDWWVADATKVDPGTFITKFTLRVAELRQEVNTVLPKSVKAPENLHTVLGFIKKCHGLEAEYREWEDSLPEEWRVKTVAWVDNVPGGDLMKAEVCPGKVDMYPDIFIAAAWNNVRISRLFISGLIVRCAAWICHPVNYKTTPEYATCARVGVDMVVDILASIPFHLGWRIDESGHLIPGDLAGFDTGADDITSPKALGGFYCIWPLFCVISSDYATDSQRTWIRGRMNLIADVMGLNQAKVIGSFEMRLPSMIVRRDMLGHAPPTAQQYAQWAALGAEKAAPPTYIPITTQTISQIEPGPASPDIIPPPLAQLAPTYTMTPLQQREAMKRETWDKERRTLLEKASNYGGTNAELIISNYLAI